YVYFLEYIEARVRAVREAFGGLMGVSYAVKANPNREIVRRLHGLVDHLDVSSGGEILLGREAGWQPDVFTFVGPAKAEWELELALEAGCGLIVAESEEELKQIDMLASERGVRARVALRLNPLELPEGFGVSMSRRPTIFGFDEEVAGEAVEVAMGLPDVDLAGFHVYAGTQCLNNESIAENLVNTAELFGRLIREHGLHPSTLIFGSGFGIPYHDRDRAIDLEAIVRQTRGPLEQLASVLEPHGGRMHLELGRYIVGEAGHYLARVARIKETRGHSIIALDGGMNHHLAASGNLGGVIKRNYPIRNITRCTDEGAGELRAYDLAGPMCTNIDMLGRAASLPPTRPGDVISIGASGAYGPTASPVLFISHRSPREVLVSTMEPFEAHDITESGTLHTPIQFPGPGPAGESA
ncbi:MAG: type III PLP-dependent enzyme, partial [Gemmatimonadota bacterium]|nr:type III PLP-dependent enzyme [Gemmatimonadota bacterium]